MTSVFGLSSLVLLKGLLNKQPEADPDKLEQNLKNEKQS